MAEYKFVQHSLKELKHITINVSNISNRIYTVHKNVNEKQLFLLAKYLF